MDTPDFAELAKRGPYTFGQWRSAWEIVLLFEPAQRMNAWTLVRNLSDLLGVSPVRAADVIARALDAG